MSRYYLYFSTRKRPNNGIYLTLIYSSSDWEIISIRHIFEACTKLSNVILTYETKRNSHSMKYDGIRGVRATFERPVSHISLTFCSRKGWSQSGRCVSVIVEFQKIELAKSLYDRSLVQFILKVLNEFAAIAHYLHKTKTKVYSIYA